MQLYQLVALIVYIIWTICSIKVIKKEGVIFTSHFDLQPFTNIWGVVTIIIIAALLCFAVPWNLQVF